MAALFWNFLCYSFVGFLLEIAFARAVRAEKQDRKCLYLLPLCPVYGLGAAAILALAPLAGESLSLLFLLGCFAATGVEYLYDLACDRLLHVRFWDYSSLPFNLRGRVCLLFSCFWGALALVLVRVIQPGMAVLLSGLPGWVTLAAALPVGADVLFTLVLLHRTGDTASLRWYLPLVDRVRAVSRP